MQDYTRTEVSVGLFIMAGLAVLAYLSLSLGGLQIVPEAHYHIQARFASVGELKIGSPVKLAGVQVGKVKKIRLKNYAAEAELEIHQTLELPDDSIASIRSSGLLGEAFVSLTPGASEANMKDGDRVMQTEPAIDLIHILSKYAFGAGQVEDDLDKEPF